MESHTSGVASQDSPLRRKFSEPIQANSISTKTTPSPSPEDSCCKICGEHVEPSADSSASAALKWHMENTHPSMTKTAPEDGTPGPEDGSQAYEGIDGDDDEDAEQLEGEDLAAHQMNGSPHSIDYDENTVDVAENGQAQVNEMNDEEKGHPGLEADDAEADGDGGAPEGESDVALSNQLHEFSREEGSASVEKRLHNFWNIHDVHDFAEDYDETTDKMNEAWRAVFPEAKRGKKRDLPEVLERPGPYNKTKVERGEFLEMTPIEDFLAQLRDPEKRSTEELYSITENVDHALEVWQNEYLAIDKLLKLATRHALKTTSDPRKLERSEVFEDKKEAMLYGYKHDPKEDKIGFQYPFLQGGFKPTPAQARKMTQKAGPANPNPDGWRAIDKFGIDHVPKFQNPPREDHIAKATRKRKAAELEAAKAMSSDDATATETPTPVDFDQDYANGAKRRMRTRRGAADAESTTDGRPLATRGRGGRARGRGAARGGSRAASEAPLAPAPSFETPARSTPVPDGPALARAGASQLVPIEPAPNGGTAPAPATDQAFGGALGDGLDAAESARRQKIMNSKNPKRTEAMLNHWARFNREGRVRNPKRSKAQIEADKAADAVKKSTDVPKLGMKQNRKSASPVLPTPPRPEGGLAPAPPQLPMAPPPQLAPAPQPQPHPHPHPHAHPQAPSHHHAPQLPPIAAARGGLAPYPPSHLEPRPVPPFSLGPREPGPLHQPPPQPYRTPYPNYFSPYGAPGMPPPGHPRP